MRGVMRHNKCNKRQAYKIIDEAARKMSELLAQVRLETAVEDEPPKS